MDDVEYAKLNHKKRRGKPQKTKPHLEDPTTIVYADIRTSHIQLPVEDPKLENTARCFKCRNITKILILIILILIIFIISCGLAFSIEMKKIKKHLYVNTSKESEGCVVCPEGWLRHRENCYYISSGREYRTWKESREVCEGMGADLLVIEDREQQGFINRSINQQTDRKFWIGLYRDGDGWRWMDGRLYNTGLFQISEEYSGDCVWMGADSGYNKDDCLSKHNWICQKRSLKI